MKRVRIYKAIQTDGTALWPDVRPINWLLDKRDTMPGPYFNAQYQNDPSGLRGVRYDIGWLQFVYQPQIPPLRNLIGIQCGDPATSQKESSNYFGHCTGGRDPSTGIIYILGFAFGHIPATEHLNFLWAQYNYWTEKGLQISKVLLEEAGPQQGTTQRLAEDVRLSLSQQMPMDIAKPKGSKEQRFDSLLPWMKNGKILFPGEPQGDGSLALPVNTNAGFEEFQREWTAFPKGGRDDLLDAFHYVCDDFLSNSFASSVTEANNDEVELARVAHSMSADEFLQLHTAPKLRLEPDYDSDIAVAETRNHRNRDRSSLFNHGTNRVFRR